MSDTFTFAVLRDAPVKAVEIEDLRAAVGWERSEGTYDRIIEKSYTHFTIRKASELLAFVNVISDGIGDAFLVDLIVHPGAQRRGLGKALVEKAVADLTGDGIQCIWVTFDPELEGFYRGAGFHILRAGIIDNESRSD